MFAIYRHAGGIGREYVSIVPGRVLVTPATFAETTHQGPLIEPEVRETRRRVLSRDGHLKTARARIARFKEGSMSMKIAIAAVVLAVTSGGALAQSTTAKVPTGIDVAGSAYYVIPTGTTKVVQIAEPCTPRAEMTRNCINTARGGERPDKESANK